MVDTSQYTKAVKNPDGSINWVSLLMFIIAIGVLLTILYFVISTIRNQYSTVQRGEPWLVETTKSTTSPEIYPGKNIPRSTDGQFGIEFSYALWVYVDKWTGETRFFTTDENGKRINLTHILHKGDGSAQNQGPGIWLQQVQNDLRFVVKMNTFHKNENCKPGSESCYLEKCDIGNIPMNKWVHLTLVVINRNIDLYINGFLKKRCLLKGLPRQNDGDVYLNAFGGFNGFLSRVRYFNYALPIWKIEQIIKQGPSEYVGPNISQNVPPYLAYNWWNRNLAFPFSVTG